MTRKLIVIRHAKAVQAGADVERPLAPRGHADAKEAGRFLAREAISPEIAAVSPARRALQTWADVQAGLAVQAELVTEDRIYDNDVDALLDVVNGTRASVESLVMVGHNPSLAELSEALDDGTGDTTARRRMHREFPTCAIAIYDVPCAWDAVAPGSATLRIFAVPRAS